MYGQFVEYMGRCIDGGIFDEDSPLSDSRGFRRDVLEHGWKEEIQSFSQSYGNLALDSSLLLMEPYGFIPAADPRYRKTVLAVRKALFHKGLMLSLIHI